MDYKKLVIERCIEQLEKLQFSSNYINVYKYTLLDDVEIQLEIDKVNKDVENLIQKILKSIDK